MNAVASNTTCKQVMMVVALMTANAVMAQSGNVAAPRSSTPRSVETPFKVVTAASGLVNPWGLAFLPDNRLLVTERPGRMRIVESNGKLSEPLQGVPPVFASGQGGLLDVTLDPQFAVNQLVYWSYAEPGQNKGVAGTAVARGRLQGNVLRDVTVIWRQTPKVASALHWGSRLVFDPRGRLFITTGERYEYKERAQDLSTTLGKVIRINTDGSIPTDNPFVNRKDVLPEIWSYGHRNIQAAALHPDTGELWTVEHGARGGDELNHPQAGRNYDWPIITYGVNYTGFKIGEGTAKPGMEQPVYYWDPVIAPSGAVFYTGEVFKEWRGDLFVGSLTPGLLVRLRLSNGRVISETRYLQELGERIRDVQQSPDGYLYLLTDNSQGRILRLEPKR